MGWGAGRMNEGIHLDLDTWIVPGQIRKANLCQGVGNRYTPAGTEVCGCRGFIQGQARGATESGFGPTGEKRPVCTHHRACMQILTMHCPPASQGGAAAGG